MRLRISYKKKNKEIFFLNPWSRWRKQSDPELDLDPDPLVGGTDPRIRILTKMSRIPNTDFFAYFLAG